MEADARESKARAVARQDKALHGQGRGRARKVMARKGKAWVEALLGKARAESSQAS
jgi:hypothetical protein